MMKTDKNGFLECDLAEHYPISGPTRKCNHIKEWVANGSDANAIRIADVTQVPVSLSLKGTALQIPVYIDCEDSKTPPCEVHFQYTSQLTKKSHEAYIGLLSKGEGRLVLRSMIWDWLLGKYPENYDSNGMIMTPCPAGIHGYQARLWMEKPHKSWEIMECLWHIETEGCCTHCWHSIDASNSRIDPRDVKQENFSAPRLTRPGYRGPKDGPEFPVQSQGYLAGGERDPRFNRVFHIDPKRSGKSGSPTSQFTVLPDGKILIESTGQIVMPDDLQRNTDGIGIEVSKPTPLEFKFEGKIDPKTRDLLFGKDSIKGHNPQIQAMDEVRKWTEDMRAKTEKNIARIVQEEAIKNQVRNQLRRDGY